MKYLIIFSFLLFCQNKTYSQPSPFTSMFEVLFFDKEKSTKEYFEICNEVVFYNRFDSTRVKKFYEFAQKSSYCIIIKRLNSYYLRTYGWGISILSVSPTYFSYDDWHRKIDRNVKNGGRFNVVNHQEVLEFGNTKDEPVMGFSGYVIPTKLLLQKQTQIKSNELMKISFVLHYPKLNELNNPYEEEYIKDRSKKVGVSFKKGTHLQITIKTDETLLAEEDPLLDEYITFEF